MWNHCLARFYGFWCLLPQNLRDVASYPSTGDHRELHFTTLSPALDSTNLHLLPKVMGKKFISVSCFNVDHFYLIIFLTGGSEYFFICILVIVLSFFFSKDLRIVLHQRTTQNALHTSRLAYLDTVHPVKLAKGALHPWVFFQNFSAVSNLF